AIKTAKNKRLRTPFQNLRKTFTDFASAVLRCLHAGGSLQRMSLKLRSILILVVGTVMGLTVSLGSTVLAEREADRATAAAGSGLSPEHLQLLTRVVERVRAEYVDPIEDDRIIENAIRGILSDLDPHSKYLPPDDYEEVRISTTGNYSGVGLDVAVEGDKVTVVSAMDASPAAEAGLRSGDVLLTVDGVPVDSDNLEKAVSRMRGEPGTVVRLDVQREGVEGPLEFALTRADIHVQTVRSEIVDGRV